MKVIRGFKPGIIVVCFFCVIYTVLYLANSERWEHMHNTNNFNTTRDMCKHYYIPNTLIRKVVSIKTVTTFHLIFPPGYR